MAGGHGVGERDRVLPGRERCGGGCELWLPFRAPAARAERSIVAAAAMAARHRARIRTSGGIRTCFEARVERDGKPPLVARFGGIPLTRNRDAILTDRAPKTPAYPRKELVTRLMAGRCELCGDYDKVRVHQVRALASLDGTGTDRPAWMTAMARKRRNTLIVCRRCHDAIHGHPTPDTA